MKFTDGVRSLIGKVKNIDIKKLGKKKLIIIGVILFGIILYFVYSVVFYKQYNNVIDKTNQQIEKNPEEVLSEFNESFKNEFISNGYQNNSINKMLPDKDIVFSLCNINEDVEGKYNLKLNVPVINMNDEVAQKLNQNTQKKFVDGANALLQKSDQYTIYTLEYESWINDNILSLVIKSNQKVGSSSQKEIVEVYNIDLETKQEVSLGDIIKKYNLNKEEINTKIKNVVQKNAQSSNSLKEAGFSIYERDLNSDIYNVDNIKQFYLGNNGQLYIIFPYGNDNQTSEIDIIECNITK